MEGQLSLCSKGCGDAARLQKASQAPCGEDNGTEFRNNGTPPPLLGWNVPPPPNSGLCCLKTAVNGVSGILIDLIIADLTVFDARQGFIN